MATINKVGILEEIKRFVRPFLSKIPNNIRYIKKYNIYFKNIDNFYQLDILEKRNKQLEELRKILKYAYENVPYYTELFDTHNISYNIKSYEDFEKIPYLTKEIIRQNKEKLKSKQKIKKIEITTGGTTGMPMEFYLDKEVSWQEICFLDYYWKKFSLLYDNTKKIVILRGNIPSRDNWFELIGNKLILSSFKLNKLTIKNYLKKIEKFNPDYIHIYPSSMNILAEYINENNLFLNLNKLKGIFSSSETLYEVQKNNIEKAFKCKICDLYGNSERTVFALNNIKNNKYTLDLYYSYTEIISEKNKNIIKEKDRIGEIVTTGFRNKSMPLIRYKTGDIGITDGSYDSLKKILGRKSEYFIDKYSNKILFTCSDEIFWNIREKIEAYQYIQNIQGKVDLNIQLKENIYLEREEFEELRKYFKRLYENIELEIIIVERIFRTKRGKFRYLIQNLEI